MYRALAGFFAFIASSNSTCAAPAIAALLPYSNASTNSGCSRFQFVTVSGSTRQNAAISVSVIWYAANNSACFAYSGSYFVGRATD